MFVFSLVDATAKFLTDSLHPLQIVWSRQLGLLICVIVYIAIRGTAVLRTSHPRLQITRGVLAAGSASLFVTAVAYVPLADAAAVAFVAPFFVTLIGAMALREPVGPRRWAAVALGFLGTMIVIRPGTGAIHPAVFLVVVSALFFALRQILSRVLGPTDGVATTVAYTAIAGSAVLTIPLPFVWQTPEAGWQILLLILLGTLAAVGEFCIVKALDLAQAVAAAPLQYTLIIWSSAWGFLVFGDIPDLWTWVGAAIIAGSGLYTVWREAQAGKGER